MNSRSKAFFLILLALEGIISTRAQAQFTHEHDVTKYMDEWIARLFKFTKEPMKKLFSKISATTLSDFSFDIGDYISPLGGTFYFRDVYMNVSEFRWSQLDWRFSENTSEMLVFVSEFTVRVFGCILKTSDEHYTRFETFLGLENTSFTFAINADEKISQDFRQNKSRILMEARFYDCNDSSQPDYHRTELDAALLPAAVALLRENLNQNPKFAKSLRAIFDRRKSRLVKTYSDLFTMPDKYYYLIPQIPFFGFHLKNVIIHGLWNLESIKVDKGNGVKIVIKDIRGSLDLDFGTLQETPLELMFKIDHYSLWVQHEKFVSVDVRFYSVSRANSLLPYRQSTLIMQRIELAIAEALLFVSFKEGKVSWSKNQLSEIQEIELPIKEILNKSSDKSDWQTFKQTLREWIPFNDNYIGNLTKSYNYYISFPNVTVNLISKIPYPEEIQCEFPDNLKMTQEIKAKPIRKLRLRTKKGNGIDINFHANVTSISFSQIKPNVTEGNGSCEFQIYNNEDIRVQLLPEKNTSLGKDELELKQKIDATLISMAKERVTQNIKSVVCFPFKVCSQTKRMVDGFLIRFVDNVLEKCLLQRITK